MWLLNRAPYITPLIIEMHTCPAVCLFHYFRLLPRVCFFAGSLEPVWLLACLLVGSLAGVGTSSLAGGGTWSLAGDGTWSLAGGGICSLAGGGTCSLAGVGTSFSAGVGTGSWLKHQQY